MCRMCVYKCVCVCCICMCEWCRHIHVMVHMYVSEDNLMYQSSPSTFFETGSLGCFPDVWARSAGLWASRNHPGSASCPPVGSHHIFCLCLGSGHWDSGSQTFIGSAFTHWAVSPAPAISFECNLCCCCVGDELGALCTPNRYMSIPDKIILSNAQMIQVKKMKQVSVA